MTYAMPEEPKNDVVDSRGQRWTRINEGGYEGAWFKVSNNVAFVIGNDYKEWVNLVAHLGPLEDFVQKYNVVYQKNNGLVSTPGDTKVYERDLTKEQAQRVINSFLGTAGASLVLKFERDVMFQRRYNGYVWTYTIEPE